MVDSSEEQDVIDRIYDKIDEMMREGQFKELDDFFGEDLDVARQEGYVLLSYLTASLPAKFKLPERNRLYEELVKRDYFQEELSGLD
jgi:hypothetical protein